MNKMINNTIKTFRIEEEMASGSTLIEKGVVEKLINTVEMLREELLIPRTSSSTYDFRPLLSKRLNTIGGGARIDEIERRGRERAVVGIDSTCLTMAESRNGILLATRATAVVKEGAETFVERIGPLLVYISEDTISDLKKELFMSWRASKLATVDPRYSKQIVMNLLERWLLWKASSTQRDAIVLVDGSLRESCIEPRGFTIRRILKVAEANGNTILGISKRSKLFKWCSEDLMDLMDRRPPVAVEVDRAKRYLKNVLGRIYFALLSADGLPIRVDVPYSQDPIQSLNELCANDDVAFGYPETLRQAHIFSKLCRTERIGLKSCISLFDAKLILSERERNILFGFFNRRSEDWVTYGADNRQG
jgi:hypothetical protein